MRVHIIHHDNRSWPRPLNHLDARECPTCGTTVHGPRAQAKHQNHHLTEREFRLRLNGWLEEFAKRTGMTEEEFGCDWTWGAEVEGAGDELESAE